MFVQSDLAEVIYWGLVSLRGGSSANLGMRSDRQKLQGQHSSP